MWTLVLVVVLLAGIALLHGYVESFRHGPSHCMGCGKCDHNGGVCVLTGKPILSGRKPVVCKDLPVDNG